MRLTTILVATTCGVLAAVPVHAGPAGTLDPGFGIGGRTQTFVNDTRWGLHAVARQADGKIVAAGGHLVNSFTSEGVLVRYLPDGTLDVTFGTGGVVTVPTGGSGILAVVVQSSGKLVVAGQTSVRRYDTGGALDLGFGTSGVITTDYQMLGALAVYPDDRIAVAGSLAPDVTVARFDADGSPDATFGTGGEVVIPFTNQPYADALALQADGAIVVTGADGSSGPFFLLRCDSAGLDPTFGSGGIVTPAAGNLAVAIQSDGKILSGGFFGIARYDALGVPDPSFNPGVLETEDIVVQTDGRIVGLNGSNSALLTRYETNGAVDASFGLGGTVGEALNESSSGGLVLEPGGKLVVGVTGFLLGTGTVARYLGGTCGDGNPDDGEECDDGNLTSGDGCDANCCLADADADGACDSNDPCTVPQSAEGSIKFTRLLQGGYREQKVRGSLRMGLPEPVVPTLDPLANGLRLVLADASGTLFDLIIPGGAFADPGMGWSVNAPGTKWQWKDRLDRSFSYYLSPAGIDTIKVARTSGTPASYKVVFKGRGDYGYLDYTFSPPLSATVVFDTPTAQGGQCGAVEYAPSQCAFVGGGGTLLCR